MKLKETLEAIKRHGIPEGYFTVGGVDGGEFGGGIECVNGTWITYQTERGKKIERQTWFNEEEACAYFFANVIRAAEWSNLWHQQPAKLADI